MPAIKERQQWENILDFWFPEAESLDVLIQIHRKHWLWRMQGGADDQIQAQFSDLTDRAARGCLEHWALEPRGRLALIILLDQFSRSVWRNSARAFAQDSYALSLVNSGFSNGHYASLPTPWHQTVFGLPLGHCEGNDHLQRIDLLIELREAIAATAPIHLQPIYSSLIEQAHKVRQIIAAFGRHPHRNKALNRRSTAAEKTYIAEGLFPHTQAFS